MKAKVNQLDDGRKKIWICVLAAVSAAVIIGVLYWIGAPSGQTGEGFLIRSMNPQRQEWVQPDYIKEAVEEYV